MEAGELGGGGLGGETRMRTTAQPRAQQPSGLDLTAGAVSLSLYLGLMVLAGPP